MHTHKSFPSTIAPYAYENRVRFLRQILFVDTTRVVQVAARLAFNPVYVAATGPVRRRLNKSALGAVIFPLTTSSPKASSVIDLAFWRLQPFLQVYNRRQINYKLCDYGKQVSLLHPLITSTVCSFRSQLNCNQTYSTYWQFCHTITSYKLTSVTKTSRWTQ